MTKLLRDAIDILHIAGLKGTRHILKTSRFFKKSLGNFCLIHSIIILEKCDLNRQLKSDTGLNLAQQTNLNLNLLSALCEYLCQVKILKQLSPGVYKVKDPSLFDLLCQSIYACYAYQDPFYAGDKLLSNTYQYGKDIVRNDYYDAIASAALTSVFSYKFAAKI